MNFLKLLFNPIFLLAAGLHAGLLLIPVAGGSSDSAVPAPDPEGESITVTRIPPRATQSANPSRPTSAAPRSAASSVAAVRQSATATQPSATNQQGPQRRTQNSQQGSSSDRMANSSSNNRRQATRNNRSNRGTNRDSTNEIAVLPANDNSNSSPSNNPGNPPTSTQTEQTPPTLVALKDGAKSQEVPQPLQNFLARLRHSVLRTTNPEVEEAKQTWLATLGEQPEIQISDPQDLDKAVEINYPLIAAHNGTRRFLSCLTPAPEKGLVGVVVNPDGEIATEPAILRSSGYDFLNDIALEKVKDYQDFPDEDTQKLYTINVDVDYDKDSCVDLSDLKQ